MKPSLIIKDGREAAYRQVARQLRSRLGEGKLLREDGRLPSFRQLSAEYGVSICVIQQAMRLLREEALIEVHHGRSGRVVADAAAEAGILKLGLIHPYVPDGSFGRQVPYALLRSVEELHCNAMVTVRSSEREPKREREIAENLLYNGFDGIILSPEDTFANAAFFEELSQSIPVMLLDQAIPECFLPAVVTDYADGGDRIGRDLRRRGRKRALVLLNDRSNSSIRDMVQALARHVEVAPLELPFFTAEEQADNDRLRLWDEVCTRLADVLRGESADTVFTPFDSVLDTFYCREIPEELRRGRLGVTLRTRAGRFHAPSYYRMDLVEWRCSFLDLYPVALGRLLKWRASGRRPSGTKKLKITFYREYHKNNHDQ
ncbi:GntR family transcriptional regulator [uncultured Victivallis sp.]|mgnify:FL=1|uniref:GntR family transcriptional regulator n=1 Tax=uncultured Victivallis sp. TaxID=354118 RepID=UPI0025F81173|nr:GntR family transcriptional regulator [uncultured Victivallis sp.]